MNDVTSVEVRPYMTTAERRLGDAEEAVQRGADFLKSSFHALIDMMSALGQRQTSRAI